MKLLAFNNDAQLKADLLVELHKHRAADAIIRGSYGEFAERGYFRGCAVGCSINSYNILKGLDLKTSEHINYQQFGIPQLLAKLEDSIFEGLPTTHNLDWPIKFMSAINVGADLSTVWPKFAQWLMTDEKYGVLQYAKTDAQKDSIQKVSDLYKNCGSKGEFILAANAAYATNASYAANAAAYAADATNAAYATKAAAYATYAASYATNGDDSAYAYAAAYATYAAAYADNAAAYSTYAASYATNAVANAATNAAKRFEVRIAQSEYLIKLLKECKC